MILSGGCRCDIVGKSHRSIQQENVSFDYFMMERCSSGLFFHNGEVEMSQRHLYDIT